MSRIICNVCRLLQFSRDQGSRHSHNDSPAGRLLARHSRSEFKLYHKSLLLYPGFRVESVQHCTNMRAIRTTSICPERGVDMSRRFLFFTSIMLLYLCLGLAAVQAATVTLNVITWSGDPAFTDRVKAFEQANPNIKVNYTATTYTECTTKVLVMTAAGTAPDVYWTPEQLVASFGDKGINMPLQNRLPKEEYAELAPGIISSYWYKGNLQGIPFTAPVTLLYYNKSMFAEAGLSDPIDLDTDQLQAVARKLTTFGDKVQRYGFEQDSTFHAHYWYIAAFGGDYTNAEATVSTMSKPETMRGLQLVADMALKDRTLTTGAWNTSRFLKQQSAMLLSHAGAWSTIYTAGLEVGMGMVPHGTQRGPAVPSSAWSVSNTTKYPQEALAFLRFMVSDESQLSTARAGRAIPTKPHLISTRLFANWPAGSISVLAQSIAQAKTMSVMGLVKYSDWDRVYQKHRTNILAGRMPVLAAVEQMDLEVAPLLNPAQ